MGAAGQNVAPEIPQPQEGPEGHAAKPGFQGPEIGPEAPGVILLGAGNMHPVIERGVIGFLIDADIVGPGFANLGVFRNVHGINFNAHRAEAAGQYFHGFRNVGHVALGPGLPGQEQNVRQTTVVLLVASVLG